MTNVLHFWLRHSPIHEIGASRPRRGLLRAELAPKMSYPLVRDLAAEGIPVRLTCGVLGHSTQAYYAWRAVQRDLEDAYLTNTLIDAHGDDPEFGYRFLADELERAGQSVGERRVWRLCLEQKLWSTTVRKGRRGSGKTPRPAVRDDLVQRDFTASRPDKVWLTDITEHPTAQGKVYCCAIKDVFSNRIVGYALDERMTAQLAVSALRAAIARRAPRGVVVVHSDRGSQFRARNFRAVLTAAGLQGSMGRVASAGDNAAMESFFSLLQKNVLDRRRWSSRDELHYAIMFCIEHSYNRRRRQRALGRLTPVEFEPGLHRSRRRSRGMINHNRRQPKLPQNQFGVSNVLRTVPRLLTSQARIYLSPALSSERDPWTA